VPFLAWFMKLVRVGKLINTHGLDGVLVMQVFTDTPEVFAELEYMMLALKGSVKASQEIEFLHPYKDDKILVGFMGVEDIDSAARFKGMDVVIPEEMLPELDDEIYWSQLEGSPVFDSNGAEIGTLVDYMEAGETEIFRIKCDDEYYLISNNKEHVLEINVKEKKLVVAREGLISEDL